MTSSRLGENPDALRLFGFLCCLEEADRERQIVEAVWPNFLHRIETRSASEEATEARCVSEEKTDARSASDGSQGDGDDEPQRGDNSTAQGNALGFQVFPIQGTGKCATCGLLASAGGLILSLETCVCALLFWLRGCCIVRRACGQTAKRLIVVAT